MPNLKNLAAQKARKMQGISEDSGQNDGLTTYDDLLQDYDFHRVDTTTGKTFLVEPIRSGSFFLATGSPMLSVLESIDTTDQKTIQNSLTTIGNQWIEQNRIKELLDFGRCLICASVKSVNFAMKPLYECDKAKKEVPVSVLTDDEVNELVIVISRISGFEEDTETVEFFRKESEGETGEGEPIENIPDSETIQPETERPVVSEGEQPA